MAQIGRPWPWFQPTSTDVPWRGGEQTPKAVKYFFLCNYGPINVGLIPTDFLAWKIDYVRGFIHALGTLDVPGSGGVNVEIRYEYVEPFAPFEAFGPANKWTAFLLDGFGNANVFSSTWWPDSWQWANDPPIIITQTVSLDPPWTPCGVVAWAAKGY